MALHTALGGICFVFGLWYALVVCRTLRRCGVAWATALLPGKLWRNLNIYRSVKVARGEGSLYHITLLLIWTAILCATALLCCAVILLGEHLLAPMAFVRL